MTYLYVLDCFNMMVLGTVFITVIYLYGTHCCIYSYDVPVPVNVPVPGTKKVNMTYDHGL